MPSRLSSLTQPLLTLAAFGAGCSVATASGRLAASGASTGGVWAAGAFAAAAFVAASWVLARAPRADRVGGSAKASDRAATHATADKAASGAETAPRPETETERRADEDWRAVATGGDGLRRSGLAAGDCVADE